MAFCYQKRLILHIRDFHTSRYTRSSFMFGAQFLRIGPQKSSYHVDGLQNSACKVSEWLWVQHTPFSCLDEPRVLRQTQGLNALGSSRQPKLPFELTGLCVWEAAVILGYFRNLTAYNPPSLRSISFALIGRAICDREEQSFNQVNLWIVISPHPPNEDEISSRDTRSKVIKYRVLNTLMCE